MEDLPKSSLPPDTVTNPMDLHLWYVRRDIGEIKVSIAELKNGYVSNVDFFEHKKADEDHEQRIRALEESRWKIAGSTGVIVGFISIIGSYLVNLLL